MAPPAVSAPRYLGTQPRFMKKRTARIMIAATTTISTTFVRVMGSASKRQASHDRGRDRCQVHNREGRAQGG